MKKDLTEGFLEFENKIKDPNFRNNKGLSNEVPYYVFDYETTSELELRKLIKRLEKKYKDNPDFSVVVFDLYDIIIDTLEKEGFIDFCFDFEEQKGFQEITIALNEMLRMEEANANNVILSYIKERTPENSVVCIIGIGKCYPFLRSHKILNNMHQFIDNVPVVLFFPGVYTAQGLSLFSEIDDGNYYRAFKLIDWEK